VWIGYGKVAPSLRRRPPVSLGIAKRAESCFIWITGCELMFLGTLQSALAGKCIKAAVTHTHTHTHKHNTYEGRLESSWTHITSSRNFVEMRWRSLFRSTSVGKRCSSYNALPTSRKRAANRWSLRNFLPRSSLFMVWKDQKLDVARSELYGGCCEGVPLIYFFLAEHRIQSPHAISCLY
jgi:hypothetical protein